MAATIATCILSGVTTVVARRQLESTQARKQAVFGGNDPVEAGTFVSIGGNSELLLCDGTVARLAGFEVLHRWSLDSTKAVIGFFFDIHPSTWSKDARSGIDDQELADILVVELKHAGMRGLQGGLHERDELGALLDDEWQPMPCQGHTTLASDGKRSFAISRALGRRIVEWWRGKMTHYALGACTARNPIDATPLEQVIVPFFQNDSAGPHGRAWKENKANVKRGRVDWNV